MEVDAVSTAVERLAGLVVARLGRHVGDPVGRHVGRVGDEHVDPAAQVSREGVVEVALVERGPQVRWSARSRAPPGSGRPRGPRCPAPVRPRPERRHSTSRPRPVSVDCAGERRTVDRRPGQQLGPAPRHEHARSDDQPSPEELDPAEHGLQRLTGDPAPDQVLERSSSRSHARTRGRLGGCSGRRRLEEGGLVLRPDASGGTEPLDDGRTRHASTTWNADRRPVPGPRSLHGPATSKTESADVGKPRVIMPFDASSSPSPSSSSSAR